MIYKLILLKKYNWGDPLKTKPLSKLSTKEIIDHYEGFEGEGIFYESFENNYSKINEFIYLCKELLKNTKNQDNYRLLYLGKPNDVIPDIVKKQGVKLGYDYGGLADEYGIYSSVFQEILLGNVPELVTFKDLLNANFLFSTFGDANEYVKMHYKLTEQEKDVEMEDGMEIYEIWKLPISN